MAQLVFKQVGLHQWQGRLVNSAGSVDRETGKPVTGNPRFDITENATTGTCSVLVQRATFHGRRYVSYPNLEAAQRGGLRWAKRQFESSCDQTDQPHS